MKYCFNPIKLNHIRIHIFSVLLILSGFISSLPAEEVCKFAYTGQPEDLHDTTIIVSKKVIALSEYVHVGIPIDFIDTIVTPTRTIFFIIDHSGSMCFETSNPDDPQDRWGNRFKLARDLIDTLYKKFPITEVGIAVFRQYLYFDPVDNPLFVQCPQQDTGAYLPLLRLDSSYAPDGKLGYEILQELLETDTVSKDDDPTYQYVDLKYRPSNYEINDTSANFNAAFDAAKHAMLSSLYPKSSHHIIFLPDGIASYPNDGTQNDYIQGDGVPTTFTLFFTKQNTAPQSLVDMTLNIQNNGYSISNPLSNLWSFNNTDYDTLIKIMLGEVVSIPPPPPPMVKDIVINGIKPITEWDMTGFAFADLFPLQGDTTTFIFDIEYLICVDSITEVGDTIPFEKDTSNHVEFEVVREEGAPDLPDTFEVKCWDRIIGFYHNGEKVEEVDETMDSIEIRFTEVEVDTLYYYDSVLVEITHTAGNQKDKETFTLSDEGSYFTFTFPREIDSTPNAGDGILQHQEKDTIIAIFRNAKLLLDTLKISIPYIPITAIHPVKTFSDKFNFRVVRSGAGQHILRVNNLPFSGKINLYAINGRKILEQPLNRGDSSLSLPKSLSQAVYLMRLEYGDHVLREKLILQ